MAEPEFTDVNVTKYVNGLSLDELKELVGDLNNNFDRAIVKRFDASSNQQASLEKTPTFFKENITSAFEDLLRIRANGAEAEFDATGLDYGSATGQSLEQSDIEIKVTHEPDCTWSVSIIITK